MSTFTELGIKGPFIKALKELGIQNPTEIQEKTIPFLGKDETDFIG